MEDIRDSLLRSIQRFLGAIFQERLEEADPQPLSDALALAVRLEHV